MQEKAALLEHLTDCNRGIGITSAAKTAIEAAITQVEARNPSPKPLEAASLLEGDWQLLYTTSQELLGIDRIPLFSLGEIYQCIRTADSRIYNIAEIQGIPFLEGIVSVVAEFEPVNAQRVEVQFNRAIWGAKQLMSYQSYSQFIQEIETGKKFRAIDFGIKPRERNGWLDITYLDADMRIGRGNVGSVFVLQKV